MKRPSPITLALLGLIGVGAFLWWMMPGDADEGASVETEKHTASKKVAADEDESIAGLEVTDADRKRFAELKAAAPPVEKLDPTSQEFFHYVDDVLPSHLYQEAVTKCYRPGLDRNERMTLKYRLRAKDGRLAVTELKILDSKMAPNLQACVLDAVQTAAWRDEKMPDWEDEDELSIQVGGMKKYLPDDVEDPDERFADPPEEPKIENDGEGGAPITEAH